VTPYSLTCAAAIRAVAVLLLLAAPVANAADATTNPSARPATKRPVAPKPNSPTEAPEALWRVVMSTDKSTQSVTRAAATTNVEGYALFVFRTQEGPVYAMFLPPPSMRGQVGSRAPVLRIDAAPPVDLEARRKETPGAWPGEPVILSANSASFVLAGKGKAVLGDLRDLMNGQKLAVQWFNADGAALDTVFDLQGAKEAIAKAVDVPLTVDPAALRAAEQRGAARRAALAKCAQWTTSSLQENCRREAMEQFAD
jgi:hypothetical protein